MQQLSQPADDLLRIFPHIVLDPVQHHANENIGVDLGDKLLVLVPHLHGAHFLVDHIQQKPVYKGLQVFFNLLSVYAVVNIQNERLVLLNDVS